MKGTSPSSHSSHFPPWRRITRNCQQAGRGAGGICYWLAPVLKAKSQSLFNPFRTIKSHKDFSSAITWYSPRWAEQEHPFLSDARFCIFHLLRHGKASVAKLQPNLLLLTKQCCCTTASFTASCPRSGILGAGSKSAASADGPCQALIEEGCYQVMLHQCQTSLCQNHSGDRLQH